MKKMIARTLALTLCAAMVCALPAFAVESETAAPEVPAYMAPVRVWGRVTRLENGAILVQNSNENDPYREIILHLSDTAPVVDAVTGLPLDRELRNGEVIYAWVGPAMTLSLPPQAAAEVVVAGIPADFGAPQYYQVARIKQTGSISRDGPLVSVEVAVTSGLGLNIEEPGLRISVQAELLPWKTRQIVHLEDLQPGSQFLAWTDSSGQVTRVLLFPYAYRTWLRYDSYGGINMPGEGFPKTPNGYLTVSAKEMDGEVLLPIRAVAEAAGCKVEWVKGRGAVVSEADGSLLFSVLPGQDTAQTADGEWALSGACFFESGTTYLPAGDLAALLNLFLVY